MFQHSDLAQCWVCGTFREYAIFQHASCSTEKCLKTYEGNYEEMAYTRHWLSTHIHIFTKMKVFEYLCRAYADHAIHQLWETTVYWTIIQVASRFTMLREFENPRGTYRESGVYSTLWNNTVGGMIFHPPSGFTKSCLKSTSGTMQKVPYTQISETTVWGTIFQQTFGFTNLDVVGNLRGELRQTCHTLNSVKPRCGDKVFQLPPDSTS